MKDRANKSSEQKKNLNKRPQVVEFNRSVQQESSNESRKSRRDDGRMSTTIDTKKK